MRYYLWALFLILNPFYFYPAGKPQIGDYMMGLILLASIPVIKKGIASFRINSRALLGFLIYSLVLNVIIGLIHKSLISALIIQSFFVYNVLVFFLVLGLAKLDIRKLFRFTQIGVLLSITIQVGYFFIFGSENFESLRPTFFFKNPNQLGYYGLLMLSIFVVLNKIKRINIVFFIAVFLSCMLISLLSASKAALGGSLFLFVYYIYDSKLLSIRGFVSLVFIVGVSYWFIFKNEQGLAKTLYVIERVEQGSKSHEVTEWQYRGYDRMTNHPGYLVLGAGEGAYKRFKTYIKKHEMHSSFGTLLFCYGIPGMTMIMVFFVSLFKGLSWRVTVFILPVVLYGFTHNGLRFTPLWILLALFPVIGELLRTMALKKHLKQESDIVVK